MQRNGVTSKYTHLIWDWNGTLQDDAWLCLDIMNGLLQKRHKSPITFEQYRNIFGFPVRDYYQKAGFDFEVEPYEALAVEYISAYNRRSRECKLQSQAVEVLEFCAEQDFSQYLLSASEQKPLENNITHYGLVHYFHRVVGLSDFYAKGKVEHGKELVAEIDAPAEKIVLIGDTIHDYEVAQALGVECVLFSGGHQTKERLSECGTMVVDALSELLAVFG